MIPELPLSVPAKITEPLPLPLKIVSCASVTLLEIRNAPLPSCSRLRTPVKARLLPIKTGVALELLVNTNRLSVTPTRSLVETYAPLLPPKYTIRLLVLVGGRWLLTHFAALLQLPVVSVQVKLVWLLYPTTRSFPLATRLQVPS